MNVLTENLPMLLEGTGETLAMVFVSALFAYVIGLPLGVALIVTDKNGLHPMRGVSAVLGWIGIPLMNANLDALLRTSLPLEMQGRVYAACNALQFFTIPLGYLLGGALVDALSASEALGAVPLLSAAFGAGQSGAAGALLFLLGLAGTALCLGFSQDRAIRSLEG